MKSVFCLYDDKARHFGSPIVDVSMGALIRGLNDLVAAGDSVVAKHPGDFVVYDMGSFDDLNGVFELRTPALRIGTVDSLIDRPVGPAGAQAPGAH